MEKMTSSVRTKIPFDVKRSEYLNLINPPSEESTKNISVVTKNKKYVIECTCINYWSMLQGHWRFVQRKDYEAANR